MAPSPGWSGCIAPEGPAPSKSPAFQPSVAATVVNAKKYVSHACEKCRSRRSRCDGQLPVCSACSRRGSRCTYSKVDRRRGKLTKNDTDALQEKVRNLDTIVTTLRHGSDQEAFALLQQIRVTLPSTLLELALPNGHVLDNRHESPQKAVKSNAQTSTQAVRVYAVHDLPPKLSIIHSIDAYFNFSHALFSIYERHEMDDILDRVYRRQELIDNATLCELCALAAVGSRYYADEFEDAVTEALYHTAKLHVEDCAESNFLRGMRATLCVGMYSLLTKPMSARLSLARSAHIQKDRSPSDLWVPYRKVYRSIVFVECWLSSRLGYQPAINQEEMEFAKQEIRQRQPTVDSQIQVQLCMLGLIMTGISQDIYKSSPITFSIVEKHYRILSQWRDDLPHEMQLSKLVKGSGNVFSEPHRTSLILLHVIFFGAQMLVQRRLLVAMAQCGMKGHWTLDGKPEQGARVQQQCVEAAETCVHLLHVLGCTRPMFRRCWLCIGPASTACSVLLFDAAQRLLYEQRDRAQAQLAKSEECVNILDGCAEAASVPTETHQILLPLHQELQRLATTKLSRRTQSSIYDLLENPQSLTASTTVLTFNGTYTSPISASMMPVMHRAIEVLENPFWKSLGIERRFLYGR